MAESRCKVIFFAKNLREIFLTNDFFGLCETNYSDLL